MNSAWAKSTLPSPFAALRFLANCFGVEEKDLADTLDRMRSITPNGDKHFPPKLSRVMLMRAEKRTGPWQAALVTLHREALYEKIRRANGKPLFSFTGEVADEISSLLLTLYERLLPRLEAKGVSTQEVLWLLVENVFVPTAFINLADKWRLGLGTEFQGEASWYLPMEVNGVHWKPISRVLDCWLRVAGFRTAYGVSQKLSLRKADRGRDKEQTLKRWESWKKGVGRWLKGERIPHLSRLHGLVEKFPNEVEWLDTPSTWKARFTLACAMQRICDRMDIVFRPIHERSSLTLAGMFRQIAGEGIVCDDNKLLADPYSFFAVRLLQLRLKKEDRWEAVVPPAKPMCASLPSDCADQDIEAVRRHFFEKANPGNRLLEYISSLPHLDKNTTHKHDSDDVIASMGNQLFEIGVIELNRLLQSLRKRASKR